MHINNKSSRGFSNFVVFLSTALVLFTGIGFYTHKNRQARLPNGQVEIPAKSESTPPINVDDGIPTYSKNFYGTFINPYLNFSLKLPENWYAYISNIEAGTESVSYINQPEHEGVFFIRTENLYKNLTFKENVQEWFSYYQSSTSELGNFQPEIVDKKEFLVGEKKESDTI